MRTTHIGNITVTYQDATSFLKDNLFIELVSLSGSVGADITVTDLASGKFRKLHHISELNRLVFPLNDTYMSLWHDAISFNVVIDVYGNGVLLDSFGFDTDVLNGKSIPSRAHGSEKTVYAYENSDLYKMQFLFPASGYFTANGNVFNVPSAGRFGFDLRTCITHSGTYQLCYGSGTPPGPNVMSIVNVGNMTPYSGVVQFSYSDQSGSVPAGGEEKGDIWNDSRFNAENYCVTLVYEAVCKDFNFFEVMYTNTDGCYRFLGGKILSQTTNATKKNYYRLETDSVYRNISRKYQEESNMTVKVAYDSLRRDSYWDDILLSDDVFFRNYDGTWMPCSIEDKKITVNADETQDVEIEYQLYID